MEITLDLGHYLGVPVVVRERTHDGWAVCLWPDDEKPRKGRPYTYAKGDTWRIPISQVTVTHAIPIGVETPFET